MPAPATVFVASDYRHDASWLGQVVRDLRARGLQVIDGPRQAPGTVTHFDLAQGERLFAGVDVIVMTTRSVLSRDLLDTATRLRGIVFPTIGTESLDLAAASALGVIVAHGPTPENFLSMAESTVMLMLALMYRLHASEQALRRSLTAPAQLQAQMLRGKTIGLVGPGRIASAVIERLQGWGVDILVSGRPQGQGPQAMAQQVPLPELLARSDIVSIHATLTPETRHLIGAAELACMKPSAFLVNTARGGIVDEEALYQALAQGRIAGAALDTFEVEPLPAGSPLRALEHLILTPHSVGHTRETLASVPLALMENVERILRGELPLYCRNPQAEPAWRQRLAHLLGPDAAGPISP